MSKYVSEEVSECGSINAEKLIDAIHNFAKKYGVSVAEINVNVVGEPTYYDQILTSIELEAWV